MTDFETKQKTNRTENLNPLLTGDILFQNRIDQNLRLYRDALADSGIVVVRLGCLECLHLDLDFFLNDKEMVEMIPNSFWYFCKMCKSITITEPDLDSKLINEAKKYGK